MAEAIRVCVKCGAAKPESDFYVRMSRGKPYIRRDCKACEKARATSWAKSNPERVQEIDRARYARDPEKVRARLRAARVSDPERIRAYDRNSYKVRRSRVAGSRPAPIPRASLDAKLSFYGNRCAYCGDGLVKVHWDHWKPLSKGGSHILANLVPSCPPCNQTKSAKWPYRRPSRQLQEVG